VITAVGDPDPKTGKRPPVYVHEQAPWSAVRNAAQKGAAKTTRLVTTPVSRSRVAKSMPCSTAKGCRCGSSSTPRRSRTATGPRWSSTRIRRRFPWLELIWADGGYNAWQVEAAVAKVPLLRTEIVKRSDDMKGFVVLPRRWVVERTFSWFGRNRRLAKDFENLAETPATFVTLASIQLALRRLARA
jgi:transposase